MASTHSQSGLNAVHHPPPSDQDRKSNTHKQPASLQPSPLPPHPVECSNENAAPYVLNPPSATDLRKPSPTKGYLRPRTSDSGQGQGRLGFVSIGAPSPAMFPTDSPIKRNSSHSLHRRAPSLPLQAAFSTFPSAPSPYPTQPQFSSFPNDGFADFPDPSCQVRPLKRTLMESAPLKDRAATKKQKRDESATVTLPEPHEMPPIEDDGSKPPYSYATLIGMAILRAPERKLTLAQIYKWISDTFAFYRSGDSGWQNSIRHNLSLNKAFKKNERPKEDPGKGNYWAIEPGMEAQFVKDKSARRATLSSIPLPPIILQRDAPTFAPQASTSMWRVPPPSSSSLLPAEVVKTQEPSSDATILASDPALQEDGPEEEAPGATVHPNIPRSSPPQVIRSSPPVAPSRFSRQGTPPTPTRPMASSAAVPRSRNHPSASANDSGYYSSLESSVMRTNKVGHILTSDLDIEPPRMKRGRAEEEIARIRSSSHDISPSHSKALKKNSTSVAGSSPFRGEYVSLLPPPLTPMIKFKKPPKPPPSLSPNTNLRNHRRKIQQMVNSPIKHLGLTDEDLPWSPAFTIHDETSATPNENVQLHFDIFADSVADVVYTPYKSPEKRHIKRETNVLAESALTDITSTSVNKRTGRSLMSNNGKASLSAGFQDSPSKIPPHQSSRFLDASNDDFFSFSMFEDSPDEVDGVDLLQGFKKIGGNTARDNNNNTGSTTTKSTGIRHQLNRNYTSFF